MKKLWGIFLAALMVIGCVGCGNGATGNGDDAAGLPRMAIWRRKPEERRLTNLGQRSKARASSYWAWTMHSRRWALSIRRLANWLGLTSM